MSKVKVLAALFLSVLGLLPVSAQSSDFEYPIGIWVNCIPGEEGGKAISVWIDVYRETQPDPHFNNRKGCGDIIVSDNKTEKETFRALLNYSGKGLNGDMGNGIYYFNVYTKSGQTGKIGFRKKNGTGVNKETGRKYVTVDLEFVSPTGVVANQAFLKESLFPFNSGNGSYSDPTLDADTKKDFMEGLRDAEPDVVCPGFGNRKLYVSAHANLAEGKPYYAKPKGTSAINIRERGNSTATKIAELKPGETLPVVDEYEGWCQVRIADKKFGWISLSVVTLTNTPSATTASIIGSTSNPGSFTMNNGKLGPIQIGKQITNVPKSTEGLYDKYVYKKETFSDEDGSWTEDYYYFYKNGKKVFGAKVDKKVITSIVLLPGSSFIKTHDNYFVGCSARDVFSKKKLEWSNYYQGEVFGSDGHYTYYVNDEDVTADIPAQLSDFKANAKISKITYN